MKNSVVVLIMMAVLALLSACGQEQPDVQGDAPAAWQEQYDLGFRYLSEGNYEQAIIAFTAVIEIDPQNVLAYFARAEARAAYVKEAYPESPQTPDWPGEQLELWSMAEADYQKALELDGTLVDAYIGLATLYSEQKRWDDAQEILDKGLQYNRGDTALQQAEEDILSARSRSLSALLRQLDYDMLLSGLRRQGNVKGFVISDADQDGRDELFVACYPEKYPGTSADVVISFDEKEGRPYCLSTGFFAAAGGQKLLYSIREQCPVLMTSVSSLGGGESESYAFWNGTEWETRIFSQIEPEQEEVSGAEAAGQHPVMTFQGKTISREEYTARVDGMELEALPDNAETMGYYWIGQMKPETVARVISQHLVAYGSGDHPTVHYDIDGDGKTEQLWAIANLTDDWYANDSQHNRINSEMGIPSVAGTAVIIADQVDEMIFLSFGMTADMQTVAFREEDGNLILEDSEERAFRLLEWNQVTKELTLEAFIEEDWALLYEEAWYMMDEWGDTVSVLHFEENGRGTIDGVALSDGYVITSDDPMDFTVDREKNRVSVSMGGAQIVYDYIPDHKYGPLLLQVVEESLYAGEIQRRVWYLPDGLKTEELREQLYEKERLIYEAN